MNREIIPCRKRGFDSVLYNLWPLLTPWLAVSMLSAAPVWAEAQRRGWPWAGVNTAPVRAKARSRGARYKYPTSYSLSTLAFLHPTCHAHTSTHLSSPPLPGHAHWTVLILSRMNFDILVYFIPCTLITHASCIAAGMGRAFSRVCLFVRTLKGKRLKLSTPNFDFNEIWHVGRVPWVMHDGMQYDPIQGQGQGCDPFKVGIPAVFKCHLLRHLQRGWQLTTDS